MWRFQAGHSVVAYISDFLPYFYVPAPRGFTESDTWAFTEYLNVSGMFLRLTSRVERFQNVGNGGVKGAELIKRRSLWGYRGDDWIIFIKITLFEPRSVPRIRDKFPPT